MEFDQTRTAGKDAYLDMELLRFTTAGSVDDGKSTLIGRLMYDTKTIFEDQLEAVERTKADGDVAERARADCASAYRALHESVVLEASVRTRLGNPAPPGRSGPDAAGGSFRAVSTWTFREAWPRRPVGRGHENR